MTLENFNKTISIVNVDRKSSATERKYKLWRSWYKPNVLILFTKISISANVNVWRFIDCLRTLGHEYDYKLEFIRLISWINSKKKKGKIRRILEVIKVSIHDIAWKVKGSEWVPKTSKENSVRNLTNWLLPAKKKKLAQR